MGSRILLIAALLTLVGCDETPTGRNQLALVPDALMAKMGQRAFAQMKQQQPSASNAAASVLVECVARATITAAAEQYPSAEMPESWEVTVFDNPSPNAFALPGGRIGVNTGLLRLAQNPSQLATVIGHEVGHVLANHGNERLTQQLGIEGLLFLIGVFSEGEVAQEQLLQALGLGAQLGIALPFSRAQEREADLMGLNIMAAAGFQPRQSVALWRNMAAQSGAQPIEFLSTHPAHDSRIENLRSHMDGALKRFEAASPASCAA